MKNELNKSGTRKADKVTRRCVGCNEIRPKGELIRIVRDKEGNVSVDISGRANGRGAYLCRNAECLKKAIKSRALNRSFKCEIDKNVTDDLLNLELQ